MADIIIIEVITVFKEIKATDIKENPVDLIKNQWGLLTAGNESGFNTMTVSWGSIGELWGFDMLTLYVRPQRYTKEFMDSEEYFTLSFYPKELKGIHAVCGSKSGRDVDKAAECSLTPAFTEKAPYFDEAKLVIVCKKVAVGKFESEQFVDKSIIDSCYPDGDYHIVYYGKIEKVLINE